MKEKTQTRTVNTNNNRDDKNSNNKVSNNTKCARYTRQKNSICNFFL